MRHSAQIVIGLILVVAAADRLVAGLPVRFEIDAAVCRPISPYIYGTNQPDWQRTGPLFTLTRWGGNRTTAYNWETNASNAGADWHHQNDGYLSSSDVPGEPVGRLVANAHAAGASVVVTVPILGYVAADKLGDGDVARTPDYLHKRFFASLPRKGRLFDLHPNPRDTTVYQDEFVNWVEKLFPESRRDARRTVFYALDNEPDLWSQTHARIHREKTRYDEIVRLNVKYASAIKAVAPQALVFGPAVCSWDGFDTLRQTPDAQERDFLEFYLDAMRAAERKAGQRLLDVLDIHWYPEAQGDGVRITEDDARRAVAAVRVQAPRSLWDAKYVEPSWIANARTHGPIRLLPRMMEKIDKCYPGTRLAITEYYYGGGGDISGALAQADVLGIFGREGVFAAALWHLGKTDDRFIHAAFAMFRNYDGRGGTFGDMGLAAKTSDAERTSLYASLNALGRVVLVAINKSDSSLLAEMSVKHAPMSRHAAVYQLTKSRPLPVRSCRRVGGSVRPATMRIARRERFNAGDAAARVRTVNEGSQEGSLPAPFGRGAGGEGTMKRTKRESDLAAQSPSP